MKTRNKNIGYGAHLIAACLLSIPSAGLILFSASQMQMVMNEIQGPSFPVAVERNAWFGWQLNQLALCGPLCSLFLCCYALFNRPVVHNHRATGGKSAENTIWFVAVTLNLFLLFLLFFNAQKIYHY